MKVDIHTHLFDLKEKESDFISKMEDLNIIALSSSHSKEEFEYLTSLKKKMKQLYISYGIHPWNLKEEREYLKLLASSGALDAIGEYGFDAIVNRQNDEKKREEEFFIFQTELAIEYSLPVVLHVRRAISDIFRFASLLKNVKSVVFHSFSGTSHEAESLLKKGLNAYFSYGTPLINGRKKSIRSLETIPMDRVITETDAPYIAPKGKEFTSIYDLEKIYEKISEVKKISHSELEAKIYKNFCRIF